MSGGSADYKLTAESNYSFHDTYSQFFLLGSNDFTIPKYWLANANLSIAPRAVGPGPSPSGGGIFSTRITTSPGTSSCRAERRSGRRAGHFRHPLQLQVLRSRARTRRSDLRIVGIVLGVLLAALALAWLKLRGPDIPYQVLEEKYGNAASRFVDLPGGFHVHYQDEGHPSLPLARAAARLRRLVHELGRVGARARRPLPHHSPGLPRATASRARRGLCAARRRARGFRGCVRGEARSAAICGGGKLHGRERSLAARAASPGPGQCARPRRCGGLPQREAAHGRSRSPSGY
jgi:hypothetical protein